MAHVFRQKSQLLQQTGNPITHNHTPGAAATVAVLSIKIESTTARTGGSPTIDGTTATQVGTSQLSGEARHEMWYVCKAFSGAQFDVSVPNAGGLVCNLEVETADAGSGFTSAYHSFDEDQGAAGTEDACVLTAAPLAVGDFMVASIMSDENVNTSVTAASGTNWDGGLTLGYTNDLGNQSGVSQYSIADSTAGTSTVTFSFSNAGYAAHMVVFKSVAGATEKTLADSGSGTDALTGAATSALADTGAGSNAQTIAASLPLIGTANLLENGDAENADSGVWAGWGTPVTLERSTEQVHGGTYSRKLVTNESGDGAACLQDDHNFPATIVGETYKFSGYIYVSSSTANHIRPNVGRTTDWGEIAYGSIYTVGSWVRFEIIFQAQTTTTYCTVLQAGAGAATFYCDDWSLERMSTESGVGVDALSVDASETIDKALADAGAGTDALSTVQTAQKALADAGTGSDAQAIAAVLPLADTGTGIDARGIAAATALADLGAGVDALAIAPTDQKALADSGSGTDALSQIQAATALLETGAGIDTLSTAQTAQKALGDTGAGVDVQAIQVDVFINVVH